jgi:hypothetical protein
VPSQKGRFIQNVRKERRNSQIGMEENVEIKSFSLQKRKEERKLRV